MALWGTGEIKPFVPFEVIYCTQVFFNATRGLNTIILDSPLSTGATIPDPSTVEAGVAYTDIYRAPLIGTFEGGLPASISDRR